MKNIFKIFILLGIWFSAGCGVPLDDPGTTAVATPSTTHLPTVPPDPTPQATSPLMPSPLPSTLQTLIGLAKKDLAQRLSISAETITLVETTETEWSDSSLGCPQEGMSYLQVITPGYRIVLEADGQQYEYHSNSNSYVIYCNDQNIPLPPKP